jgi:hypothetical protein
MVQPAILLAVSDIEEPITLRKTNRGTFIPDSERIHVPEGKPTFLLIG